MDSFFRVPFINIHFRDVLNQQSLIQNCSKSSSLAFSGSVERLQLFAASPHPGRVSTALQISTDHEGTAQKKAVPVAVMSLPCPHSLLLTSSSKLLCDNTGICHLVWVFQAATKQNHRDILKKPCCVRAWKISVQTVINPLMVTFMFLSCS